LRREPNLQTPPHLAPAPAAISSHKARLIAWRRRVLYTLSFVLGSVTGLGMFQLALMYGERTGQSVPLPQWWVAWLFAAHPALLAYCAAVKRPELCAGLGFDGGPLAGVELAWLLFAQGAPFGLAAVALVAWWQRRRVRRAAQAQGQSVGV
jgi:hypothetical protein